MTLAATRPTCCRRRDALDKAARYVPEKGTVREIKEWQAIMDHLRSLPVKKPANFP